MFNLSQWSRYRPARAAVWIGSVCDAIRSGRMPLPRYTWMHAAARLSDEDRALLCAWAASVHRDLTRPAMR
jgi:Haem-binding domain